MKTEEVIDLFVQLRDRKREVEQRHKAELEPYNAGLAKLEGMLLAKLDEAGVPNMATHNATVFKSVTKSVRVRDWHETLEYIIENEAYDLLEQKVAKTPALERGDVPGLEVSQAIKLNVRRK